MGTEKFLKLKNHAILLKNIDLNYQCNYMTERITILNLLIVF